MVVAFTDNYAFDGPGDDIYVSENVNSVESETVDVHASSDNVDYVFLGSALYDEGFDLSDYENLDEVRYLRIEGTSNGGQTPGYDLLSIEALNSKPSGGGPCVGVPSSTLGVTDAYGASDLATHLIYFLVPLGAVVLLRILRRKR